MEQQSSLQGASGIRSLTDHDSIFQAFDAYPWTKDKAFMSGLYAILGEPNSGNPQAGSPRDIATHARIFYYAQRIGVTIDFTTYQAWLAQRPDYQPPHVLPDGYGGSQSQDDSSNDKQSQQQQQSESALPWQQAAPRVDLYVDRSAQPSSANSADQPNYPMAFAEMIKLLQEGKEIPGIRQIPNTIARDPSIKPVGSRTVPRKPWEKDSTPTSLGEANSKMLDMEFPPVEAAASVPSTTGTA